MSQQTNERSRACEGNEQYVRASGPVLMSGFLVVLDHSELVKLKAEKAGQSTHLALEEKGEMFSHNCGPNSVFWLKYHFRISTIVAKSLLSFPFMKLGSYFFFQFRKTEKVKHEVTLSRYYERLLQAVRLDISTRGYPNSIKNSALSYSHFVFCNVFVVILGVIFFEGGG